MARMGMGERIKQRRKALGMSLRDLGDKVHRSHGAIANWEAGATPSVDLELLARVLQTTVRWLRDGENGAPIPEVDTELLGKVLLAVEQARAELGLDIPADKFADLVATLYALTPADSPVDSGLARRLVRMAA